MMTEQSANAATLLPPWSGFHHIALVTRDLDATIRFYRDVLGMEIVFIAPAGRAIALEMMYFKRLC